MIFRGRIQCRSILFLNNLLKFTMFSHWTFIIEIGYWIQQGGTSEIKSNLACVLGSIPIIVGGCHMYIYLYIDVAMCLMALVQILRLTLMIIEKCKRHQSTFPAKKLNQCLSIRMISEQPLCPVVFLYLYYSVKEVFMQICWFIV